MSIKTYLELRRIPTFEERYRYLQMNGRVGEDTFGFDRYINQGFYRSKEWKRIRDFVIVRDNGCDLGIEDRTIAGRIIIHHMNPIGQKDILWANDVLMDPMYLICVSHETHNAIHYGDENLLAKAPIERTRNDTYPWKH